jgi:RNA polymerase sigma-70 factor (ECF subfamily)
VPAPDPLDAAVARLQEGDEAAFREVYRAVQPPLLRYLTTLVGPHDAEDVAAEGWSQAVRDLDRFSGDADGFRAWLTTICRHRAMDHLRRAKRRPACGLEEIGAEERPDGLDVEAYVLGQVGSEAALTLIATLPQDQREAIVLRTVLGFDAPTAARILGKRPGAVRTAAHRGLRTLAKRLADGAADDF